MSEPADPAEDPRLHAYLQLLRRYHRTLDLMSSAALGDAERHLREALAYGSLLAPFSPARLLDLGSGAGLPGIPLALALPRTRVILCERRRRRSTFLTMAVAHLDLSNVEVHAADVRDLEIAPVQAVTAQAVARFEVVYCLTRHLHAERVVLASRKGDNWPDEAESLSRSLGGAAIARTSVPLAERGTLVALELAGGLSCPSSG